MPCSRLRASSSAPRRPGRRACVAAARLVACRSIASCRRRTGRPARSARGSTIQRKAPCPPMAPEVGRRFASGSSDAAVAASAPARHSTIIAMPMPLCPPIGSSAPSRAAFASVVGRPCASRAQPSGMSRPSRAASRMWPRAATLQAMSNTIGGSPGAGQAKAIGLWPMAGAREALHRQQRRRALADQAEVRRPRRPASACMPSAPRWPQDWMATSTLAEVSSASRAEPHGVRAGDVAHAPSASSTMPPAKLRCRMRGRGLKSFARRRSHIRRQAGQAVRRVAAQVAAHQQRRRPAVASLVRNAAGLEDLGGPARRARLIGMVRHRQSRIAPDGSAHDHRAARRTGPLDTHLVVQRPVAQACSRAAPSRSRAPRAAAPSARARGRDSGPKRIHWSTRSVGSDRRCSRAVRAGCSPAPPGRCRRGAAKSSSRIQNSL